MLKTVIPMSYALRSIVERSRRAVTLTTVFENFYGGSIYCLDCEFVPGFYSACMLVVGSVEP